MRRAIRSVRRIQRPRRRRGKRGSTVVLLALVALLLGWWQNSKDDTSHPDNSGSPSVLATDPSGDGAASDAEAGSALATVEELTVRGRAPRTGYERDNFGSGWLDPAGVGCDQRNIILARDLDDVTYQQGSDCIIETGTLTDPFSGDVIDFQRGPDTSTMVQIDHLVALSDAWQKGAQEWDRDKRILFANDPLNLLAVDGPLNQQKGDGDAATWLPPRKEYRCEYVARLVVVKHHYDVWVTPPEQAAMRDLLTTCPDEPLPAGGYPLDGSLPVNSTN